MNTARYYMSARGGPFWLREILPSSIETSKELAVLDEGQIRQIQLDALRHAIQILKDKCKCDADVTNAIKLLEAEAERITKEAT